MNPRNNIVNPALAEAIFKATKEAGFDDCGIISIEDMEGYMLHTQERINHVPQSQDLYNRAIQSTRSIRKQYPWAKSIVICLTELGKYKYPESLQGIHAKGFFISRDSDKSGPEYKTKQKIGHWFDEQGIQWAGALKPGQSHIWGVRHAALIAGLGIIRKNNFFYNENGSFLELDSYLIDQECRLYHEKKAPPCPEKCNACQKHCPTAALSAPYTLNPNHCVGACTTFGKGEVPEGIEEHQFGTWLVGCDACQDACPFNRKHDWSQGIEFPGLNDIVELLKPENLLKASDKELVEICMLTQEHILPEDANTLRVNAERVLRTMQTEKSEKTYTK